MSITSTEDLRSFLLGTLSEGGDQLEEILLTDDSAYELLEAEEEDLIQNYVDGELSADEVKQFETHFLISHERVQKVSFSKALRRQIDTLDESTVQNQAEFLLKKPLEDEKRKASRFGFLSDIFATPYPALAMVLLFLVGGYFCWSVFLRTSDSDIALASLNKAFSSERPIDSRISGFEYAAKRDNRGGEEKELESTELEFAKSLILKQALENPDAANLHTLGRFYLAQKEFSKAVEQFVRAEQLDPKNAEIMNDLAVTYLEQSKRSSDLGEKFELSAKALTKIEAALRIRPESQELYFNRALTLEATPLPKQAAEAWRDYLKHDNSSKWAEEARSRLQRLEKENSKETGAADLERQVVTALNDNKQALVIDLISNNRELIREKYLPQRLAFSYVDGDDSQKKAALKALTSLSRIEREKFADSFSGDLASYYENVPRARLPGLKLAQQKIRQGYQNCLKGDFESALSDFESARSLFLEAGNTIEADTIAAMFIAYCLHTKANTGEALRYFKIAESTSSSKSYKWIGLLTEFWLTGLKSLSESTPLSELNRKYTQMLAAAEEMKDTYLTQQILLSQITSSDFTGSGRRTSRLIGKLLASSKGAGLSVRQKSRSYGVCSEIVSDTQHLATARAIANEGLSAALETKDDLLILNFRMNAGVLFLRTGDFDNASAFMRKAAEEAQNVESAPIRESLQGSIYYYEGHIAIKTGRPKEAAESFDKAAGFAESLSLSKKLEIEKSQLFAYWKLKKFEDVDAKLKPLLSSMEKFRSQIHAEEDRFSFFGGKQDIYDLAVENELRKGNTVSAFEMAELSNARSLLAKISGNAKAAGGTTDNSSGKELSYSAPVSLKELQSELPESVQILEYTTLSDRLLVWVVKRDGLELVEIPISSDELKSQTDNYTELIVAGTDLASINKAGQELFKILIAPVISKLDQEKSICIVPGMHLYNLPFSALVDEKDRYLVETKVVSYSPSAAVFAETNGRFKPVSGKDIRLLSIGNPAFDTEDFGDLQPLPAAEKEAREVAKYYGESKTLTGKEATKSAILEGFEKAGVLHFAGHYVVAGKQAAESGLVVAKGANASDNLLTDKEIAAGLFRNTQLVVLSACDTGSGDYIKGEGIVGTARTFLGLGVPLVLASRWKVDSNSTAELMIGFHEQIRQHDQSPAAALRQAQIKMIKSNVKTNQNPANWAAFGIIGGA